MKDVAYGQPKVVKAALNSLRLRRDGKNGDPSLREIDDIGDATPQDHAVRKHDGLNAGHAVLTGRLASRFEFTRLQPICEETVIRLDKQVIIRPKLGVGAQRKHPFSIANDAMDNAADGRFRI